MGRTILYLGVMLFNAFSWALVLIISLSDYTSSSPDSLNHFLANEFSLNQPLLVLSELVFPLGMLCMFIILTGIKIAAKPIRMSLIFMLSLSVEFWIWRTFFFTDRMGTYYFLNEHDVIMSKFDEPHLYFLTFSTICLLLMALFRETTVQKVNSPEQTKEKVAV